MSAAPYPPPRRAVWEITRRCTLRCAHCLVDAGPRAPEGEPDTTDALRVCDALAELGVQKVSLTGGEPLSRPDWATLVERLRSHGLVVALSTNAQALFGARLETAVRLGVAEVALSVDGLATHDHVRRYAEASARRSSFAEVAAAIDRIVDAGLPVTVITTVRADNLDELPALHDWLRPRRLHGWLVQLAHATGRMPAADTLPVARLPELAAWLRSAAADPVLPPTVHNTIGWMSKDEPVLRSSGRPGPPTFWQGTPCGRHVIGIEPDGGVKGCPNQVGAPFVVGRIPQEELGAIWQDRARWFWVDPPAEQAQGTCAPCGLRARCGGGCPCVAFAMTRHTFDNPACLRVLERA